MSQPATDDQTPAITPLAESALLLRLVVGEEIDRAVVDRVTGLAAALIDAALPGVIDVVPSYTTILVTFDPRRAQPAALTEAIAHLAQDARTTAPAGRRVTIPVAYGGPFGPDLHEVAAHTGLSEEEVIARHAGADYLVACLGFSPGFPFLLGLPPELATPRRANPRTRVPAGSVGIGGKQTAVYPQATPGGWRLIGRTALRLFDPAAGDPFLLRPGDHLRFQPIPHAECTLDDAPPAVPSPARSAEAAGPALRVEDPGMLTTVQDLGRPGLMRFGVSPGGALDRAALILGNRLVGNDPGAAALEITLLGPALVATGDLVVALTGADLGARLNGEPVPCWQPLLLRGGDRLEFAPGGSASGVRAYLCVAGGFAVEPVLGSRSTDLAGGFGGVEGRPLRAGDLLPVHAAGLPVDRLLRRRLARPRPEPDQAPTVRVVLGPQVERFTERGLETFLAEPFTVTAKADRTGIRLTGPAIEHRRGADLLSEGIAHGAIQVPGDGQPIVLLAARQTIGGYVKIATVIGADLDRFAQLRPGAPVRFVAVSPDDARAATLDSWAALEDHATTETPGAPSAILAPARAAKEQRAQQEQQRAEMGNAWDPDGVIRVIEAARAAGVTALRIEVDGLTFDVRREPGGALSVAGSPEPVSPPSAIPALPESAPPPDTVEPPAETTVTAPVLGVFYRRRSPDEPPLVNEGDPVEAGQPIGLLEVMKTYHEVTAPHAGTLTAFLVDDAQFVEYGHPLATIAPAVATERGYD